MASKRKSVYSTESAKKRAKRGQDRQRQVCRIYIKEHWDRWSQIKTSQNLTTHGNVAGFLLDFYENSRENVLFEASTPAPGFRKPERPELSSIDTSQTLTASQSAVSGVETIASDPEGQQEMFEHQEPASITPEVVASDSDTESEDPYGLVAATTKEQSYALSDSYGYEETSDEERTQSSDDSSDTFEESHLDETILDIEADDSDSDSETLYSMSKEGVCRVESVEEILTDNATIAYECSLRTLANSAPRGGCVHPDCGLPYEIVSRRTGTALYLTWVCHNKHVGYRWCSQPKLRAKGVHAGDFLLATNIILSGNNYAKVALLCRFLNLGMVSASLHDQIQTLYCCPAINTYWEQNMADIINKYKDQDLIVAGDGRNDSPGHSAQYCTYTLMHHDTHDIVSLVVVDKRETGLKSPNMEKLALQKSLENLKAKGLTVAEMVTDAHVQISAMMRKDYPETFHSYDVWHGSKNFRKKVTAASTEKNCKDLQPWVKSIVNHFWHCARMAEGSYLSFLSRWRGILQHVVDSHEWALGDGAGPGKCEHEALSEDRDKDWLTPNSPSHNKLRQLVLDKRFLKNIMRYVNFRHTGQLEAFHNHILMYAAKRFSFSYPTYRARNQLAALDYQAHKDREIKKTKTGEDKYRKVYSKRSAQWTIATLKVPKKYTYIPDLQAKIVEMCLNDPKPLHRKRELLPEDPRNIRPNIAAVPAPPLQELILKHKSRFSSSTEQADATMDPEPSTSQPD